MNVTLVVTFGTVLGAAVAVGALHSALLSIRENRRRVRVRAQALAAAGYLTSATRTPAHIVMDVTYDDTGRDVHLDFKPQAANAVAAEAGVRKIEEAEIG